MPTNKSIVVVLPDQLREEIKALEARIAELRSELKVYGDLQQAIADKHQVSEEISVLNIKSEELQSKIADQNTRLLEEDQKFKASWASFEEKAKASMREHSEHVESKLKTMRAELDQQEVDLQRDHQAIESELRAMEAGRMKLSNDQEALQRRESQYALSVVSVQARESRAAEMEGKLGQGFTDLAGRAKTLDAERDIFRMEIEEQNERRRITALEAQQYAVKRDEADRRIKESADAEGKARSLRMAVENEREALKKIQESMTKERADLDCMKATLREELDRQTRMGADIIQREARVKQEERQVELAKAEARTLYTKAFEANAKNLRGEAVQ